MKAEATTPLERPRPAIVVLGVSGVGKTTVGTLLAQHLNVDFVDADHLHPRANLVKMTSGQPLDDADRWPWLHAAALRLADRSLSPDGCVLACSALKRQYRDVIAGVEPSAYFVHLDASRRELLARLRARRGHFMPASLLDSQLTALEPLDPDENGLTLNVDGVTNAAIVRLVEAALADLAARQRRLDIDPCSE